MTARCRQAAYRFHTAADVYGRTVTTGYAVTLSGFQSTAWKALLVAQQAQTDITNLAQTHPAISPPDPIVAAFVANKVTSDMALAAAMTPPLLTLGEELRKARVDLDHAMADRDAAASQAAAKLTSIANNDGMSDTGASLQAGETVQTRLDAYNDAQQLAWALAHADDPNAKVVVAHIADELNLRGGEPGFATDVINQSGASLGGIASLLRGNPPPPLPSDPTLALDPASQATLAAYSQALAATVRSDSLSNTALAQLASAKDPWSTAMLLKYGPNGSAYGDGQGRLLLALMARNVTNNVITTKDANSLIFPAGQDPLAAVLGRVSENPGAVQLALGDGSPEAKQFATNLATISMARPADHRALDLAAEQAGVAGFLMSCGIPPNRSDLIAMNGTLNIMTSFVDYQNANPGAPVGPAVQKALASYTVNYMSDLSLITASGDRGISMAPPPTINLGHDDLTALLKLAYPDADAVGKYKATVADQVIAALAAHGKDPGGFPLPDYHHLSSLYGVANTVQGGYLGDAGAAQDAQAADRLLLLNIISGGYGNASLDSASSKAGQPLAGILGPILPAWFDTGHAQAAQDAFHGQTITEERTMQVMVLQAYVDSGTASAADLAELAPVLKDGRVQGNLDFDKVWGANEDRLTLGGDKLSFVTTNMLTEFGWQKGQ